MFGKDNHEGGEENFCVIGSVSSYCLKEKDKPDPFYTLVDLKKEELKESSWIHFEGKWGSKDSTLQGPLFRTDAVNSKDGWEKARNKPKDPYNNCEPRYKTSIYGSPDPENTNPEYPYYGPWCWASGYVLDGTDEACQPITDKPSPCGQRFTNNGNGTVTDNWKQLVWLEDANCFGGKQSWHDATRRAEYLESGDGCLYSSSKLEDGSSQENWRLPTKEELGDFLAYIRNNQQLIDSESVFKRIQWGEYWSSTDTLTSLNTNAFVIDRVSGEESKHNKSAYYYVWPVRANNISHFVDNENGTITDNWTGLVWLKNTGCFGEQNWHGAKSSVGTLQSGTCRLTDSSSTGDWRLPNTMEREYRNLVQRVSRDTLEGLFTNLKSEETGQYHKYWAGTTMPYPNTTNYAWFVNMSISALSDEDGDKLNDNFHVWAVRDK